MVRVSCLFLPRDERIKGNGALKMGKHDRHSVQKLTACRESDSEAALLTFLGASFSTGWVWICLAKFVGMQNHLRSRLKISECTVNGDTLAFPTPVNAEGFH